MNEKANRYFALAAKYRQQGRTQMADALERQAQREMDRGAEDINDIIKENEQTATNPMRPVAPQTTQPAQQTVYQQPTPKYNPTTPAAPAPYKPTAEELANMADSEQYGQPFKPNDTYQNLIAQKMVSMPIDAAQNQADSQQYNIPNGQKSNSGNFYYDLDTGYNGNDGSVGTDNFVDTGEYNTGKVYQGEGGSFDSNKKTPASGTQGLMDNWSNLDGDGGGVGGSFGVDINKKDLDTLKRLYPEYYKLYKNDFNS